MKTRGRACNRKVASTQNLTLEAVDGGHEVDVHHLAQRLLSDIGK